MNTGLLGAAAELAETEAAAEAAQGEAARLSEAVAGAQELFKTCQREVAARREALSRAGAALAEARGGARDAALSRGRAGAARADAPGAIGRARAASRSEGDRGGLARFGNGARGGAGRPRRRRRATARRPPAVFTRPKARWACSGSALARTKRLMHALRRAAHDWGGLRDRAAALAAEREAQEEVREVLTAALRSAEGALPQGPPAGRGRLQRSAPRERGGGGRARQGERRAGGPRRRGGGGGAPPRTAREHLGGRSGGA